MTNTADRRPNVREPAARVRTPSKFKNKPSPAPANHRTAAAQAIQ